MRFVIRSKKTGKTYLRSNGFGGFDWVMFREEQPDHFDSLESATQYMVFLAGEKRRERPLDASECEIVPIISIPWSDPRNGMPTDIANWYSENGKHQTLISILRDEAILFLQVSRMTADMLRTPLSTIEGVDQMFPMTQSDDGLTWVWTFKRGPGLEGDWLAGFMSRLSPILQRYSQQVLVEGSVDFCDNQTRDHNTVESFGDLCLQALTSTPTL